LAWSEGAQEDGDVKYIQSETKPAEVPKTEDSEAKQAGEISERWKWVEPAIWTERMLTALETGLKGGKWFSLIDKVYALSSLEAAFEKVKANQGSAGADGQSIEQYESKRAENLGRISRKLREGTYEPQGIKRVYIPKPGSSEKRPLGIPTVEDRVVQTAMKDVMEPIFEKDFAERSYGFRPGRGCKDALREVDRLLKAGYIWVVDADLKSYFDSIPHDKLLKQVAGKISDGRLLDLIGKYLKQEVMESMKSWTPEEGTPQGAVISPLLSNIYLAPLDQEMEKRGYQIVRYADDFVILSRSQAEAQAALEAVKAWTVKAGLQLHPEKTRVVRTDETGFDFLGYCFFRGQRWPRKKSLKKFKDSIREKTKRTNGRSLEACIKEINRTLIGWFGYFKHSRRLTFIMLDGWIRMRLRSILRKRRGGKGRGSGTDHRLWPNKYFQERGLYSLTAAHVLACQSS
jgi:RNA-directed DNA polymerase